jgi:hypothetical protein
MGIGLVLIVLEQVNNRQLPDCGHVQRFEECALLRSAVAEKGINDLASLLYLCR